MYSVTHFTLNGIAKLSVRTTGLPVPEALAEVSRGNR